MMNENRKHKDRQLFFNNSTATSLQLQYQTEMNRYRSNLLNRRHLLELAVVITAAATHPKSAAFTPIPPLPAATPLALRVLHSAALRPNFQAPSLLYDENKHRQKKIVRSYSSLSSDMDNIQYIRPYLKQLFLLCRPVNFPIVALFHALGVHQAVQLWASNSSLPTSSLLLSLLKHPSMLVVLLSLLLVTSTSMITNDYYDAKYGVDSTDNKASDEERNHYHPLAWGDVPFSITKTFDSYLYAILLLSSAFVPGVVSRLLVLGGAIITYLYTAHLKPKTWIKNLSCAALVGMSPVTSGLAAWHVLCRGGVETATVGTLPFHLIFMSPLSFLVMTLFAGIMGYVLSFEDGLNNIWRGV